MKMKLKGKSAVVTGAARGIGFEIAALFAEEGAAVTLVDRQGAAEAASELAARGLEAVGLAVDVTDFGAVERAAGLIVEKRGGLDILVNNAGIIARESILELSVETWRKVIDVNLNGAFHWCKAAAPYMVERMSGRIVNITSIAGRIGDITASPAYGTSKGAVGTLTKSLARQLACYGITVNAVAPHAIITDMSSEWSEEKRKAVIEAIPLKRMGTAREVAQAALFLASDDAAFITGHTLDVNGGVHMD